MNDERAAVSAGVFCPVIQRRLLIGETTHRVRARVSVRVCLCAYACVTDLAISPWRPSNHLEVRVLSITLFLLCIVFLSLRNFFNNRGKKSNNDRLRLPVSKNCSGTAKGNYRESETGSVVALSQPFHFLKAVFLCTAFLSLLLSKLIFAARQ